jgi:chaperonin GroES
MRTPLIPLWDFLVVEPDPPPEKKGSIIIPLRASKPTYKGTVVAAGPGVPAEDGDFIPTEMQPGDHICHLPFNTTIVEIGDRKWFLIREKDVLCRI